MISHQEYSWVTARVEVTGEKQTRPSAALSVPPATCRARTCVRVAPSQFGEDTHVVSSRHVVPPGPRGEAHLEARPPAPPRHAPGQGSCTPRTALGPRPGPDPACKPSRVKSGFVLSGVCSSSNEFAAERRPAPPHPGVGSGEKAELWRDVR